MKWYLFTFLVGFGLGWFHSPVWVWIKSKIVKQTPLAAANGAIKK